MDHVRLELFLAPGVAPYGNAMIDEELSAACVAYHDALKEWRRDFWANHTRTPSVSDRFLAKVDSPRAGELLARIEELRFELGYVQDPGGPIGNYIEAIGAWHKTHPEIDQDRIGYLTRDWIHGAR